jgi:hypothetical protein
MVCMQRMQTTYAGHGGDSKGFSTAQPMGKVPRTEEGFRTFLMAHTTKPTVEQSQICTETMFQAGPRAVLKRRKEADTKKHQLLSAGLRSSCTSRCAWCTFAERCGRTLSWEGR